MHNEIAAEIVTTEASATIFFTYRAHLMERKHSNLDFYANTNPAKPVLILT
jgi:hypothetical protein